MARKTIVGLFQDDAAAERVVRDLETAGYSRSDISVIRRDERDQRASTTTKSAKHQGEVSTGAGAAIGAGTGAAIGGGLGLLAGAAGAFIPGIGPALGIGPLAATILGGAGIGAATGGIAGALVNSGVPHEEAERYTVGVHRGHTLVTLATDEPRAATAIAVFSRHQPINIHSEQFKSASPTTTESAMNPEPTKEPRQQTTRRTEQTTHPGQQQKFDVVEEQLRVGKREVEGSGGVRVEKTIQEKPVEEQVTLRQEHVHVDRHPVDRPASEKDLSAFKEGTIEVTERSEQPVVQKEARVIEEVIVQKDVEQRTQTIRDSVRRTDVKVEPLGSNPGQHAGEQRSGMHSFEQCDSDYRTNFKTAFPAGDYTYDQVRPAYRYGHDWASRSADRDWNTVESDARTHWEAKNPGTWERFKDSIRYGYERAKQKVTGHA